MISKQEFGRTLDEIVLFLKACVRSWPWYLYAMYIYNMLYFFGCIFVGYTCCQDRQYLIQSLQSYFSFFLFWLLVELSLVSQLYVQDLKLNSQPLQAHNTAIIIFVDIYMYIGAMLCNINELKSRNSAECLLGNQHIEADHILTPVLSFSNCEYRIKVIELSALLLQYMHIQYIAIQNSTQSVCPSRPVLLTKELTQMKVHTLLCRHKTIACPRVSTDD